MQVDIEHIFTNEDFLLFIEGDHRAYKKVFEFFYPIILRYAFSKTKNIEDAEEITQEAFTQLYLHRTKVRSEKDLYPYLFVISKRLCISHFRKSLHSEQVDISALDHDLDLSYDAENDIHFTELYSILEQIIATLTPQQQRVYRMCRIDALPQQLIADEMGLSRNTVKNHLQSATKVVRLKLEQIYSYMLTPLFLLFIDFWK